jgi:type IV fimbrial biogenesis protein FimT
MDVTLTPARHHIGGFSLVELMLVLAVLLILFGMAAPSMHDLRLNSQRGAQINALLGHLSYARSEALKSGHWIVLCKTQDGQTCINSGDWDQGWILFEDRNRNRQRDPEERLIHLSQHTGPIRLRYAAFPSSNYVIFYPTGQSLGNGTFTFCDRRGAQHARAVILAKSGRVRSSAQAADGSALSCPV